MVLFKMLCGAVIISAIFLSQSWSAQSRGAQQDEVPDLASSQFLMESIFSFENKMVKDILKAGAILKKGGTVPRRQYDRVTGFTITWLYTYLQAFLQVLEVVNLNVDEHVDMEMLQDLFLDTLGVQPPHRAVWAEMVGPTVLLLFDNNDDGVVSKSEMTSVGKSKKLYLHQVLNSIDVDQNGLTLDDIQLAFLLESPNEHIERLKSFYRGIKVTKEEVIEEISRLIDKYVAYDKQYHQQLSKEGWSLASLWSSPKARIILTAVVASVLILVCWDLRNRAGGGSSQSRRVNQETVRQQREIYLQNMARQQQTAGIPQTNRGFPENRANTTPEQQLQKGAMPTEHVQHDKNLEETASNSPTEEKHVLLKTQEKSNKRDITQECVSTQMTIKQQLDTDHTSVSAEPTQDLSQDHLVTSKKKHVDKKTKLKPAVSEQAKELSVEERLMEVLSDVLDIEVRVRRRGFEEADRTKVLLVQSADFFPVIIAVATDDMEKVKSAVKTSKLTRLFDQRTNLEYGKTACFGCRCWNRCHIRLGQGEKDPAVTALLQHFKELSVNLILSCLTEVIAAEEDGHDEGLWAGFSPDPSISTEGKQLLECISNWDEDGMKPELLQIILSKTEGLPNGYLKWVKVIRSAGIVVCADHRSDEHFYKYGKMLAGLDTLFKSPAARFILLKRLKEEAQAAKGALGSYFERESVFGPLLAVTSVPACLKDGIDTKNPNADMWTSLRGFPRLSEDDVRPLRNNIGKGRQLVNRVVACGLKEVFRADPQVAVSWLSYMLALNELRTTVTPRVQPTDVHADLALSDGFMLNVCYVLLELCLPFCGHREKVAKIDPSYTVSPSCHLGYSQEPGLAAGLILAQEENQDSTSSEVLPKSFNFMTHIFHITLRAINIGFMPSLQQFRRHLKIMNDSMERAEEMELGEQAKSQRLLLSLQWEAHLMDYDLLENGTRFYVTVCLWISHLLNQAKEGAEKASRRQEQLVLQQVPEFVVKDMAHWFTFISSHAVAVHRNLVDSVQLSDFVETCVLFLTRSDLLPGPIPASALCQTLLAFVSSSKQHSKSDWVGGGMSNLELAVHSCAPTQSELCPGLVRTYVSVDVVEGLDVDKDEFDKFSSRSEIGRLLTLLWKRMECKQSILQMCGSKEFQLFLGAIFDTLLYQLHDSLARLANVRKLELAKPTWDSLPPKEQLDKTQFLRSEEHAAKGFMNMATETVALLELITTSDEVAKCLTVMPLAKRAASAFLGFLESLCGSKSADFKVKDMKKYNWEPRLLLIQLTGMVLQIVKQEQTTPGHDHFTTSMATDPDFNAATMIKALQVLEEKTIAKEDFVTQFRALTEMLCEAHTVYSKRNDGDVRSDWKEQLNKIIDQEQLDKVYQAELGPLCYNTAVILETHAFQSNAATMPVDARSKRCRALMKETRTWMKDLPVQAQAAIFLRQDEERMDVVRAVVTGPQDTPYSLGCFVFDIYFPPTYPDIPPLVKFTTTGGGTVRFNPNLYADGKVCLSLLGTWHGGDASQKWQTGKSSLYQVLLSIQSMILISTPMYNEPGYEGIQGTEEGDVQSRRYNAKLRLSTLRHAVLSQITRPPKGFEKVIKRHFFYERDALKKQCHDWLLDTDEPELQQKMEQVVEDLCIELDKLNVDDDDEEEEDNETDSDNE